MLTLFKRVKLMYHVFCHFFPPIETRTRHMDRPPPLSSRRNSPAADKLLIISDDGYIRLGFAEIQGICFTHLISGADEDGPAKIPGGAVLTAITGYTEWTTNPALTPAIR